MTLPHRESCKTMLGQAWVCLMMYQMHKLLTVWYPLGSSGSSEKLCKTCNIWRAMSSRLVHTLLKSFGGKFEFFECRASSLSRTIHCSQRCVMCIFARTISICRLLTLELAESCVALSQFGAHGWSLGGHLSSMNLSSSNLSSKDCT